MCQCIEIDDGLTFCSCRREFDGFSIQCEGAYLVVGTIHDDTVTFEGKLVVGFYLLDACRCAISEGGNLGSGAEVRG